jgi:hypothetical protein
MMGSDLAYHVLSAWKLENYGNDVQTITQAAQLLDASVNQAKPWQALFKQFLVLPSID